MINKPIIVGATILDLSKAWMYKSYYDLVQFFGRPRISLLYIDTDSLIMEIKSKNIYEEIFQNNILMYFDFSKLSEDNKYYNNTNKDILGKFKDETACKDGFKNIVEFISLKPKMYAFTNHLTKKIAKGIKKNKIESLNIDDYKNCLFNGLTQKITMNTIKEKKFNLYTQEFTKIGLDFYDDKRCYLLNKIDSLPWGNYKIK